MEFSKQPPRRPIALFSAVEPLLRASASRVNQLRNGVRCGIVQPPTDDGSIPLHTALEVEFRELRLHGVLRISLVRSSRKFAWPRSNTYESPWLSEASLEGVIETSLTYS
jgi:hypothetical protein